MVWHFKIGAKMGKLWQINEIRTYFKEFEIGEQQNEKENKFLEIFAVATVSATEISLGQAGAKTTQKTNKLGRFLNENKIFSDLRVA